MHNYHILEMTTKTLSALPCIIGNSLILHSIRVFPQLKGPTYSFIASLAGADLILGLVILLDTTMEVIVTNSRNNTFHGYEFLCKSVELFGIAAGTADGFGIFGITLDRFLCIHFPLRYVDMLSTNTTIFIILSMWMFSVLYTLLGIIFSNMKINPGMMCQVGTVFNATVTNYIWAPVNACSVIAVLCMYAKIAHVAFRTSRKARKVHVAEVSNQSMEMGTNESSLGKQSKSEWKITKVLLQVTVVYLITYFLGMTSKILLGRNKSNASQWFGAFATGFWYTNTWINAIIYGWKDRHFRTAFYTTLNVCLGRSDRGSERSINTKEGRNKTTTT